MHLWRRPAQILASRNIYSKTGPAAKLWNKSQVDLKIHEYLYEYSPVEDAKVNLYSNLEKGLLIDQSEKFGLYLDLLEEFQLMIPAYRNSARDWQSGKEAADWIAFNLEEQGRLIDNY